jgi:hypothetical protein
MTDLAEMRLQALRLQAKAMQTQKLAAPQGGPPFPVVPGNDPFQGVMDKTVRMGLQGGASIVDLVGNPIKNVVGLATGTPPAPSYRQNVSDALDALGVAQYDDIWLGRVTGAIGEGMVGAGGMAKGADLAAQGLTGLGRTVAESMAASSGRQVAAGAGAGAGASGAAEAGLGEAGQLLFGLAGGMAGYGASGGRPAPRAPRATVESLREVKTRAYRAVDDAGEVFTPADNAAIVAKTKEYLAETNYLPEVDVQTKAILGKLEGTADQVLSLRKLDKLRQDAWARYNKSGEYGILGIIDAIDESIAARPATNGLMTEARAAHSRYKKAELLDMQFSKAERQTAATGSGGNTLNKMRQAVSNILNNPRQAKWFSDAEKAAMDQFITGTPSQNVLRLIGKLAPTGNGLMTALNLITVAANPMAIAGSGLATAAKVMSDASTKTAGLNLIDMLAGAPAAGPRNSLQGYAGSLPAQLPALSNLLNR